MLWSSPSVGMNKLCFLVINYPISCHHEYLPILPCVFLAPAGRSNRLGSMLLISLYTDCLTQVHGNRIHRNIRVTLNVLYSLCHKQVICLRFVYCCHGVQVFVAVLWVPEDQCSRGEGDWQRLCDPAVTLSITTCPGWGRHTRTSPRSCEAYFCRCGQSWLAPVCMSGSNLQHTDTHSQKHKLNQETSSE